MIENRKRGRPYIDAEHPLCCLVRLKISEADLAALRQIAAAESIPVAEVIRRKLHGRLKKYSLN